MERLVRIRAVTPLTGHVVRLEFSNGSTREIDLDRFLRGPIFEPMRNELSRFREVSVDSRVGTICWPNGADIDPDVLFLELEPAWAQAPSDSSAVNSVA